VKQGPNPRVFMLMAVGAFVLGGGLTFLAYSGLGAAKDNLKKLQADSKNAKGLQLQLADSQANLQSTATKLKYLENGVQDYAYVPTLLSELEKLGKASGIDVVGVRPLPKPNLPGKKDAPGDGEVKKKKSYDELNIEVKGRGNYRSVLNFIESLGKFPKVVAARTVEMSPKTTPGQTGSVLDVTIDLRAYIFPDQQETPAKTAMAPGITHEG